MKKFLCTVMLALCFAPLVQAQVEGERPSELFRDRDTTRRGLPLDNHVNTENQVEPGMEPAPAKSNEPSVAIAPGVVVDRIIGVVGNQIVKESDMQNALQQYKTAGLLMSDSLRAAAYDQLMFKKLLVNQANHDSINVTESEIEGETDRRMRYFLGQFKSDKEFENFYGKTVDAFKFELHDQVKELLLAQREQSQITSDVTVSPAEVQAYFKRQNPDSLPFINSEVEIGQIVIIPPVNPEVKEYTRQSLEEIRQEILKGKIDFCAAVRAYSEDPGSRDNCGTYENVHRGTFTPEFDAVCFKLKEGEISEVFETPFGFHFVQLLSRKGEEVTIRHILKTIPPAPEDLKKCKLKLDSVLALIHKDSISFCAAAAKYSMDEETRYNCGLILNPETGNSKIDVDALGDLDADPQFPLTVSQMKVGEISAPQPCVTTKGKQGYRILYLKSRSQPHRANLKDDYQLIQDLAQQEKEQQVIDAWVRKRLQTTYVRVSEDYKGYQYNYPWLQYMK